MVSDQIDESIKKEALGVLAELSNNESRETVTGYDTIDESVVSKDIVISVEGIDMAVQNIETIEVCSVDSPLNIVADILANSLYRYLKHRIAEEGCLRLHSPDTFSSFPLKAKMAYLDPNYIADDIYAPK